MQKCFKHLVRALRDDELSSHVLLFKTMMLMASHLCSGSFGSVSKSRDSCELRRGLVVDSCV